MRENKIMRKLLITLTVLLTVTLCMPGTAEAASSKAVKSVELKIEIGRASCRERV